jgi:hypothetical protein
MLAATKNLVIIHHKYFITQVPANEYNATAPSYLLLPEMLELLETEHTSHRIGDRAHLTSYWRQSTPHIVLETEHTSHRIGDRAHLTSY